MLGDAAGAIGGALDLLGNVATTIGGAVDNGIDIDLGGGLGLGDLAGAFQMHIILKFKIEIQH